MSEFKNKSITTKGMELLAKALAGGPYSLHILKWEAVLIQKI